MSSEEFNSGRSWGSPRHPLTKEDRRGCWGCRDKEAPRPTRSVPRPGQGDDQLDDDTEPSAPEPGLQPRAWVKEIGINGSALEGEETEAGTPRHSCQEVEMKSFLPEEEHPGVLCVPARIAEASTGPHPHSGRPPAQVGPGLAAKRSE